MGLRVAFILFRGEPTRGGAERYVDTLGHALIDRGHQVNVLASTMGDHRKLTAVKIPAGGVTRTGRYRRFLANLDRHLASERYDVVHACLPVRHCDVYHAHAGLEAVSLRESHLIKPTLPGQLAAMAGNQLNLKRRAFASVEASLLNGPTSPTTICLSDRERRLAERLFPTAKFTTLYSVPDESRFVADDADARRKAVRKKLGIADGQNLYLFIGQDFARKGLATAIRALGKLNDPHAILYVLGNDPDTRRYSHIAIRSNVIGQVHFAGKVENVPDFLAAADALVFPTRYEPFGMVVVEAMLMGVPPIVSGVAGSSEVVSDGETGFVLPNPNDADAWANAMRCAIDCRISLRANCLAARARFSYAAHADAIEAIYRQVAGSRRIGPASSR